MSIIFFSANIMDMLFGPSFGNIIDISSTIVEFVSMSIYEITSIVVNHSTVMFISGHSHNIYLEQ